MANTFNSSTLRRWSVKRHDASEIL